MQPLLRWLRIPLFHKKIPTEESRATWLELFYDVAFLAVITELAGLLQHDMNVTAIGMYILLYVPIWWLWIGGTFFTDRFETGTKRDRLFTFLQMVPIAGLAVAIHNGLIDNGFYFAIWYIVGRSILTFRWWQAGLYNPVVQPMTNTYVIGFSTSIIVWALSLFVPIPFRYMLWFIALLIEFITPLLTLRFQEQNMPCLNDSHLNERFGLFTIIVLAEVFIGTVHGLSAVPYIYWQTALLAFLGFVIACCLWSIYFDDVISHDRLPARPWNILWIYSHLPLTFSITAIGACMVIIIEEPKQAALQVGQMVLSIAIASVLLWITCIEYAHNEGVPHDEHETHNNICMRLRLLGVFLAITVIFFVPFLSPIMTLGLLSIILLHQVVYGMHIRSH